MCRKTSFGGEIRIPESQTCAGRVPKSDSCVYMVPEIYKWIDRKSAEKGGWSAWRIPESEASDGRMLPESEPWNAGMESENEARVFFFLSFFPPFSSVLSPGRWRSSQSRTC